MDSHKKISDVYNSKSIKNAAYSSFLTIYCPRKQKRPPYLFPANTTKKLKTIAFRTGPLWFSSVS